MSISQIKKLSMNEHYYALLLQCFLSGYGRPCPIKVALMSLPILTYSESRNKLKTAKKTSRIDTIFSAKRQVQGNDISGKEMFSGFVQRYDMLLPYGKKAIIILSSEGKATVTRWEISLLKNANYKEFNGEVKDWIRSAFYLGMILSQTTYDHLTYFLGVA